MTLEQMQMKQLEILSQLDALYGELKASYERGDFSLQSLAKFQLDSTRLLTELCLWHTHPVL